MTRRPLPPVIKPPAPAAGAQAEPAVARYGLLALGFRPFFLVAGGWAALSLIAWLAVLFGLLAPPRYLAGTHWHAHEMLFGYTAAVIAGFLLTAARNWSGLPTAAGGRLAALVALWLAARLAPWLGAPAWLIGALDIAFFPALALSLRRALWQGPNPVNRLFLVVFGGWAGRTRSAADAGSGHRAGAGGGRARDAVLYACRHPRRRARQPAVAR